MILPPRGFCYDLWSGLDLAPALVSMRDGCIAARIIRAMNSGKILAVIVTVAFSVVGVLGDYFLKLASQEKHSLRTPAFYIGFALYASTAFGWVFVMKHLKLGTISVLYSISMVLLLTCIGVAIFRETLRAGEIVGLLLAIAALVLLVRFA
jgi:drug/metabolite transporter (DMT)-like permease